MRQAQWIQIIIWSFYAAVLGTVLLADGVVAGDAPDPLFVDPATQEFSQNPELRDRIVANPHGYFRFINIRFGQAVCDQFANLLAANPSLNLHGDAHLEQYAVTDLGRGLTDYDDSCTGPGFIDWMRLGVSLQLACRQRGWEKNFPALMETFFQGYQTALENPEIQAPEPGIVANYRSKFTIDRIKYFKWVDSICEKMPQSEQDSLLTAMQPYFQNIYAEQPALKASYFEIVQIGYLHLGIGSALDLKYVVRVQGQTAKPEDDIVLELKEVRDLSEISCIHSGRKSDPFRILLGQSRIAYQPFTHLGYFSFRGRVFWVHSWVDNYKEIGIDKYKSVNELSEVLYDIGVQLGKGHVKHIAVPLDLQLRREQLLIIQKHKSEFITACEELAARTVTAWELFRKKN